MSKIIKKGTIYMEESRHGNVEQGIWVDLFVYAHLPVN